MILSLPAAGKATANSITLTIVSTGILPPFWSINDPAFIERPDGDRLRFGGDTLDNARVVSRSRRLSHWFRRWGNWGHFGLVRLARGGDGHEWSSASGGRPRKFWSTSKTASWLGPGLS